MRRWHRGRLYAGTDKQLCLSTGHRMSAVSTQRRLRPAENIVFFNGSSFWLRSGTSQFAPLLCTFLRLDRIELIEVVVVNLIAIVVLDRHTVAHPFRSNMRWYAGITPFRYTGWTQVLKDLRPWSQPGRREDFLKRLILEFE
jgi:hypothetical protein